MPLYLSTKNILEMISLEKILKLVYLFLKIEDIYNDAIPRGGSHTRARVEEYYMFGIIFHINDPYRTGAVRKQFD